MLQATVRSFVHNVLNREAQMAAGAYLGLGNFQHRLIIAIQDASFSVRLIYCRSKTSNESIQIRQLVFNASNSVHPSKVCYAFLGPIRANLGNLCGVNIFRFA